MSVTSNTSRQSINRRLVSSIVTLSLWRWRQQWFLLMMICLGMIAAITIVCAIPLLSSTMQTAALRNVLRATPESSEISLRAQVAGLSTHSIEQTYQATSAPLQQHLTAYMNGQPRLDFQTPLTSISSPQPPASSDRLGIYGTSLDKAAASHIMLKQGRLPQPTTTDAEIAVTPETAQLLHLQVGSSLVLNWTMYTGPAGHSVSPAHIPIPIYLQFTMHVVGLFNVQAGDPYWHGYNFLPYTPDSGCCTQYTVLASQQNFLAALDHLASSHNVSQVFFFDQSYLFWYYQLATSRISVTQLNDLISQLATTQAKIADTYNDPFVAYQPPYIQKVDISGSVIHIPGVSSILETFRSKLAVVQIPILILSLEIIALILLFVGMMTLLLVDRQEDTIVLIRSRGASRGQIFGAFMTQSIILSLIALIIGPLLAIACVYFITDRLLPPAAQDAVNVISNAPLQALLSIKWYAIGAAIVVIATMALTLYRASRVDVWSTANQVSSSARRPLWQRLNLDVFVALIALAGFGISVYLTSVEGLLDPQTQTLVVSPLALLAPVFLLLAIVLLFLRFLPVVLHFASRLVMRGRSAPPVMAVAQMARRPRQAVHMILLLGLATAFAIFTLVFAASQAKQAQDIAAYQAGADFSGAIPTSIRALPIQQEIARYRNITGVLYASAAYVEDDISSINATAVPIQVQAVDPASFPRATIWTANNSSQSLSNLLAQLSARRSEAIRMSSISAIVDATTWDTLNLHPGAIFNLYKNTATGLPTRYIAVARVQQFSALDNASGGKIMVDYLSLASVIAAANPDHALVPVNHIWLRTKSDSASLASVRTALTTSPLQLDNLSDRRALGETLGSDPLSLNIIGLLAIGALATLLLALVGSLLISWLSVRRRLADFVVLRAIGATFTQSASVFVWEQGIIYITALFLGIAFGALLIITTVPTLVFTNPPGGASSVVNSAQLYALQHIIPPQIVVPPTVGIVLLALVAIAIVALALMIRSVLRPSISQVLRLEEDRSTALMREDAIMARFAPRQSRSQAPNRAFKGTYVTLAFWQLRKVWFLLLVQGIGFIAAVTIVCSVPLFSTVATTASLHETLNASADTSTMTINTTTQGFSSKIYNDVQKQLDPMVQQYIGTYLDHPTPALIQSAGFTRGSAALSSTKEDIQLIGTSMDQAVSHLTLVQGQLPQSTLHQGMIDAIITPATARLLNLTVGSVVTLHADFFTNPADMFGGVSPSGTITAHIVGLFNIAPADTPFWHGEDFLPIQGQQINSYQLLIPGEAYLSVLDQIAHAAHQDTVFSPQTFTINWYYHLDTAHIAVNQVDALSNKLSQLRTNVANTYGSLTTATDGPTYPYIVQVNLYNPIAGSYDVLNTLDQFSNRAAIVTIPIAIITLLAFTLILFFASLIANLLVEQQADTIAILRSRGANISQIFGSLLMQSIALGVIALIIGPILALVVVSLISRRVLGSTEQAAISLVAGQPVQAMISVAFYALATVIVVVAAMALMLWFAARKNALVFRREAARTTQRPLWQRLNLDAVTAVIALVGYGASLYLVSLNNLFDARTRVLVVAPLTLIAPLFLLIAFLFLFLRFFTAILALGARLAMRSRGAISMLALSQMARNPRQTLRMTLLLALAIAFAIFTLVFSASQFQHISDMATYESGADFSGDLPVVSQRMAVQQVTALYRNITGVKSATVGFTESGVSSGTTLSIPVEIRAVDAHTFAQTGIWTTQDASQSLSSLMTQLDSASSNAISNDQVPVIIDAVVAHRLDLQTDNLFAVSVNNLQNSNLNCRVIAIVQHIPTVNSSDTSSSSGTYVAPGGILLDYTTYAEVYKHDISAKSSASDTYLPINHVWLSTSNDENSLAGVREALKTPGLRLQNLYDRRLLIVTMSSDPLYLSLIIVLTIGSVTALLLALVGSLLASWLNVRNRLTNFAAMRALGTAPVQITKVLLWEQVVVYATALFLGIIFGTILSATAVPTLAFTSLSAGGVLSSLSSDEFYVFQRIIPAQVVFPLSLGMAFAALVAICVVALWIIARVTLRPSMSQTLRLNED